jgi:hypothetical protein
MRPIAAALALVSCVLLLAACGSGSATTIETGESEEIGPPATPLKQRLADEERAGARAARHLAERDAARRLGEAAIPPGAHPVRHLPKSLGLDGAGLRPTTPNFVARSALYLSQQRPTEVIDWFEAHPPPHVAKLAMDSEGGASVEHAFTFGDLKGKVSQRWLTVAAVERPGGGSAIRLESQGVWVTPHPFIERIPSGHRLLEIELIGGKDPGKVKVHDYATIQRLAGIINRAELTQPGEHGCPAMLSGGGTLILTFRYTRQDPPAATAKQVLPPGCGHPLELKIRGVQMPPLEAGMALSKPALTLLGVKAG